MTKSWAGRTPTQDEWREILASHALWLIGDAGQRANLERADLERANLQRANLQYADLQGANLQGANLRGANLQRANLRGAYLQYADLQDANLQGANLQYADLQDANLQGAYLQDANLRGAYLQRADLQRANLQGANLQYANLQGANLQYANLQGANLRGAYLQGANGSSLAIARTRILPQGDLVAWKKCKEGVIVKLRIPAEVPRSHACGRKCRSAAADVVEVFGAAVGLSIHDGRTTYRVGERVTAAVWDDDWTVECGGGIHWYITREEAEAHK